MVLTQEAGDLESRTKNIWERWFKDQRTNKIMATHYGNAVCFLTCIGLWNSSLMICRSLPYLASVSTISVMISFLSQRRRAHGRQVGGCSEGS